MGCLQKWLQLLGAIILARVQDGLYKLNALYPEYRYQNEWAAIKGITLLAPQEGLAIPKLVTANPIVNDVEHENYLAIGQ